MLRNLRRLDSAMSTTSYLPFWSCSSMSFLKETTTDNNIFIYACTLPVKSLRLKCFFGGKKALMFTPAAFI